jgi:cell division protein FtsQ
VNTNNKIRKVAFIAVWLCIGTGMILLLLAAITKKNKGVCKGYSIASKTAPSLLFIDPKEVEQTIKKVTGGSIKGEAIASIKLQDVSSALQKNGWISATELYFDNKDVLHITITERQPIARVFTKEGNSFYIDSSVSKMSLSHKLSARVPVVTGFTDVKKLTKTDSSLLKEISVIASFIMQDSFWLAQVAQLNITPQKDFEMVPLVGNHIVKLGGAENVFLKFKKLKLFYKQVLSKTGFDSYKVIDVRYNGQIVASKNEGNDEVDAAQLKDNIRKLIKQAAEADTAVRLIKPLAPLVEDEKIVMDDQLKDNNPPNADVKKKNEQEKKMPKAVMPKQNNRNAN